jgi:hypothetical protein
VWTRVCNRLHTLFSTQGKGEGEDWKVRQGRKAKGGSLVPRASPPDCPPWLWETPLNLVERVRFGKLADRKFRKLFAKAGN